MQLESDADRLAEIRMSGGVQVTLGVADPIWAIWESPYAEGLAVEGSAPAVFGRTSDMPGVGHGTTVSVPSVPFTGKVVGVQPTGDGMTRLKLERTT